MEQSSEYTINDFTDDFYHILSFHPNAYQSLDQHCHLSSCPSIQINYGISRQSNIKHQKDNKERLFIQMIHQQHCQIYHDNRCAKFRRFIIDNYPHYKKTGLRYVHNGHQDEDDIIENDNNEAHKNVNELPIYQTGEMLEYYDKQNKFYVWCKTLNIKEEWLEYGVSVEQYNDAIIVAKDKLESEFIKKNFVSKDDPEKPISLARILALYQYTANDRLQQELCRISRKTRHDHGSRKKLRRSLGKFGHTYKLLMTTVELFGKDIRESEDYEIKYRGMNVLVKFNSSTIHCYTPTSTTSSRLIAANFSDGTGCILELHPHDIMEGVGLDLKVFSRYPEEEEYLYYGHGSHLKVMFVHHPLNFANCIGYGPYILLEKCMTRPDKLTMTNDKNKRKISLSKFRARNNTKQEMRKKYDENNHVNALTKLFRNYVKYKRLFNKKSISDKFEEISMSGQSNESKSKGTQIKDQQQKPNIEEKYQDDDDDEEEEEKSMELYIGEKGSQVTNEIEMQQLDHMISCRMRKYNNRLFLNNILIKCINDVFGEIKIEYIIKLFPTVQIIDIVCDIDQQFIIDFVLNENKQNVNDKLIKIKVKGSFQKKYSNLVSKLQSFDNPSPWEMFDSAKSVAWKKTMSVNM